MMKKAVSAKRKRPNTRWHWITSLRWHYPGQVKRVQIVCLFSALAGSPSVTNVCSCQRQYIPSESVCQICRLHFCTKQKKAALCRAASSNDSPDVASSCPGFHGCLPVRA